CRTSPIRFQLVAIHIENFRLKNLPRCSFLFIFVFIKVREVIAFKNYFEYFLSEQPIKVQDIIFKIIETIESLERVPSNYLKHLTGTEGLYEARVQLGSNIWRVF